MSEIELVKKLQHGDMDALGELFESYKNQALKYSYLITNDRFTSEDIVQEAFIKCYSSAKSLKNVEHFRAWFFKILVRIAWKRVGKDRKLLPVENIVEKNQDGHLDKSINTYIKSEEEEMLRAEIENLELKQKTTVVLFYFNGLTIKEIAKIMGCFEGTVKSRLYSARKNLKCSLLNREQDDSVYAKECSF